jgi:hypothetical protein
MSGREASRLSASMVSTELMNFFTMSSPSPCSRRGQFYI